MNINQTYSTSDLAHCLLGEPADFSLLIFRPTRIWHRYGKTHGFSKMGSVSMGMVVGFGTLWHTMYPYHGIVDMYG